MSKKFLCFIAQPVICHREHLSSKSSTTAFLVTSNTILQSFLINYLRCCVVHISRVMHWFQLLSICVLSFSNCAGILNDMLTGISVFSIYLVVNARPLRLYMSWMLCFPTSFLKPGYGAHVTSEVNMVRNSGYIHINSIKCALNILITKTCSLFAYPCSPPQSIYLGPRGS